MCYSQYITYFLANCTETNDLIFFVWVFLTFYNNCDSNGCLKLKLLCVVIHFIGCSQSTYMCVDRLHFIIVHSHDEEKIREKKKDD